MNDEREPPDSHRSASVVLTQEDVRRLLPRFKEIAGE